MLDKQHLGKHWPAYDLGSDPWFTISIFLRKLRGFVVLGARPSL